MDDTDGIFIGGGGPDQSQPQRLLLRYANRHGLIAGATGTGKTVTLQIMAEAFSAAGVPVILADVKGDLAGLAMAGSADGPLHGAFAARAATIGLRDIGYRAFPVTFWDLFGDSGHPVRTTVAEMGPLLLSRLLELNDVQEGVVNVVFRAADDEGLALLDLADLRAMLVWVAENGAALAARYGNVSAASVGAIQRRLLVLENQGGDRLFGEPALALADMMGCDAEGRGRINVIAADRLMASPRLYATFLLWLLSELFEDLPEVGDPDKPRLVFFFDEAHLLFDGAAAPLVDMVEQVARLIRSKGVGVYFVTQNPDDVPPDVLGQLGNRVQHALRAFTARDRRALRQAAETYRDNPRFDVEAALREVGTGEAVTSLLAAKGAPGIAERTLIRPPASRLGPITPAERATVMAESPVAGRYDRALDRDSAAEALARRAAAAAEPPPPEREFRGGQRYRDAGAARPAAADDFGAAMGRMVMKELSGTTGRRIVRGLLGTLFKGR